MVPSKRYPTRTKIVTINHIVALTLLVTLFSLTKRPLLRVGKVFQIIASGLMKFKSKNSNYFTSFSSQCNIFNHCQFSWDFNVLRWIKCRVQINNFPKWRLLFGNMLDHFFPIDHAIIKKNSAIKTQGQIYQLSKNTRHLASRIRVKLYGYFN